MNPIVLAATAVSLAARPGVSPPLDVRGAEASAAIEALAGPHPERPDSVVAGRKRPTSRAEDQLRRAPSERGARAMLQRFLRSLGEGRFGIRPPAANAPTDGTASACGHPDSPRTASGSDPAFPELGFYRPLLSEGTEQAADSTSRGRAVDESRRPGPAAAHPGAEPCAPQRDLQQGASAKPGE
jgi:hypothetical protein